MLPLILAASVALAGEPVKLGGPAWAFSLPALDDADRSLSLHDFTGVGAPDPHAAVVLHFFGPGGGDELLDELSEVAATHADVQVLGVVYDPRGEKAAASLVRARGPSFPVLSDEYRVVFSRYGIDKAPLTLVVDGDGNVFAASQPTEDGFVAAMDQVLDRLLAD